jgi:tetratricopeptide (TPR) repeat protein
MAERPEEPEAATEHALDQASPAAVALALGRTSKGGKALDAKAEAFLEKQTRLIDLQTEHLHEQRELQTSRLRWGRFSDRMKAALQVMTALVGLAVGTAFGVMAWQAHADHGVSIAAFSVPPDLSQRGLTGQVMASQLLDRLADLQAQTVTARPASTYANNWGGDIKVEIPETGVSIGELNRYLREWLGHETRISGEVVRTLTGVAVTARVGQASGKRFAGTEADLDKLVGQAAEAVYAETQPYRYAVWLSAHGHRSEALLAYARLARSGPAEDRAWAYTGWASALTQERRYDEAVRTAENAIRISPRLYPAYPTLSNALYSSGRDEAALIATRREIERTRRGDSIGLERSEVAGRLNLARALEAFISGDPQTAAALFPESDSSFDAEGLAAAVSPAGIHAVALALDHDVTASRRVLSGAGLDPPQAAVLDGWTSKIPQVPLELNPAVQIQVWVRQRMYAVAVFAHQGRFAEAETLLAGTPSDCYLCLRMRGLLAALKHDGPAADRWYAEAARQAPSLPWAQAEWGQALLARGDVEGAIAKAQESHRRGPHFVDPMEVWGEALMRKGNLQGAVSKFTEADKYAPRWGRNHLRWGEVLLRLGRYHEARAQFEAANGMDLSKPDRAALNIFLDRTAKGPLHG